MAEPYPPIEPYDHGLLDVGDGNLVYWEACGNPEGKPALVVHGGPGSGCGTRARRLFDPERYRIVLFDQRGCGRSTPHASDPATDMSVNTTHHLLADMEQLRGHLGIERWLLYGGSWGSTLLLAYAERHPGRVSEIVIPGVTLTRRADIDWLYRGVGRFFPAEWERFRAGVPPAERNGDLLAAYLRLLEDPDPDVRARGDLPRAGGNAERVRRPPTDCAGRLRADLRPLLLLRGLVGGGRAAAERRPARGYPGDPHPRQA
jgi:proline iminopeptidase